MDQKRSIDLRWLFDPVQSVILRWSCCLDRRWLAFVKVAYAKLLIPLNLSIVLKVVLDVQERALNHGIQISLKTKSGFGVFPLPLPSWTVRFHFPLHFPTTAAVAEKLNIFFSILFSKRRKRWCWSHFPDKFQAFGKFWLNQELFGLVKLTCRVCLVKLGDRDDSHHYVGFTSAGHCTRVSLSTHIHRMKL